QAEHGGFYQAVATGIYEEYGLDVTIRCGVFYSMALWLWELAWLRPVPQTLPPLLMMKRLPKTLPLKHPPNHPPHLGS
ncbi:MAG: hypothetical protein AAFY26_20015, partial [Cyanobacteria bacterium J06638_22]